MTLTAVRGQASPRRKRLLDRTADPMKHELGPRQKIYPLHREQE